MTNLPKLEDWNAPWEHEGEEIDPTKAKSFAYSLKSKIQELEGRVTERDSALSTYKEAEAAAAQAKLSDTERLETQLAELRAKGEAGDTQLARANDLLQVRLDKGLTEAEVKRISGDTLEELLADADEFLKLVPRKEGVEEEVEDEPNPARRAPQAKFRTPGDPRSAEGADTSVDAYLAKRAGQSSWLG
ncbi:MAG: hypothetical protein H7288_07270 [Kineosporiaceae bacterium]|nr:hypothetical protein [Aeromicrobium sp.]